MEITFENFQQIDIRIGKIVQVEEFPRAKKPAYKVCADFGTTLGLKWSSVQATNYERLSLVGMEIIAVVNLPKRNIAGFQSEVLILGTTGQDGELSLLVPSRPAKPGAQIY